MIKITASIFQSKSIGCLFLAAFIATIAGCASPNAANQIKSFSDATILTISNTTQAFTLVEDIHYKEEVSEEIKNYNDKTGFVLSTIQPFMGSDALQVRLDVLNGLKSYAANLSALMGKSSLTNLDQQTTKLGQALATVDTNLVKYSFFKTAPATAQEIQIFTTAINALGHWLITYKQQKDAKQVIALMKGPVKSISELLQRDFRILKQQLALDNKETLENEDRYLHDNLARFDNNPGEKRAVIQQMAALTQEMKNDAAIFDFLESAAAKLEAAHSALEEVFSKNTTNITSLIQELTTESQRISQYYSSLKTTK